MRFKKRAAIREKNGMFFPYKVEIGSKARKERTKGKSACWWGVYEIIKIEQITKPFFYEHGAVIGRTEGSL